ncbi:hypothetical protein [Leptolyngbya sp. BC1307]|uniref:hypothetical protein n=1 Tax=Leptolyngbya sp. BC1307 TaxID=2029589 RepID=UPI000EFB4582|nr:hypothetical protein [Leptolyngbya sp. BC1307]
MVPSFDLTNTEIQAALISGIFTVLSALIAAVAAAIIGNTIADRRKLQEKLKIAIQDIAFLLEVEELHCEHNKRSNRPSRKNTVRNEVRDAGLDFSGQFTPGRVRANKQFRL